jgi:glycosyltransferase involved in cell wall biosynthesis
MISIFIPVYNEEEILEASVRRVHDYLSEHKLEHEIIVGSNGSSDGTCRTGEKLAADLPYFKFFHLPARGAGTAFAHGVRRAQGEFVVTLDVDLSSDLIFIDYASDLLRYADMVVGSKTMGSQRRSAVRVIGSQLYIMISNILFDLTISDYSIGCKAFRRGAILPALDFLDAWTGHIFELCLYLHCRKKKIVQVGIDCDDRRRSRFRILHEGFYRYAHLARCWRRLRRADSWFHQDGAPKPH